MSCEHGRLDIVLWLANDVGVSTVNDLVCGDSFFTLIALYLSCSCCFCHVVTKIRYTPFIAACTSWTGNVDVVVWTLEVLGCNKFQIADVSLIRASWLQPLGSACLMLFCRMVGMASSSRAARATWTSRNTFLALVSVRRCGSAIVLH